MKIDQQDGRTDEDPRRGVPRHAVPERLVGDDRGGQQRIQAGQRQRRGAGNGCLRLACQRRQLAQGGGVEAGGRGVGLARDGQPQIDLAA